MDISEPLLFGTKTCPNCKQAERFLKDANIEYKKIFVEDHEDMVKAYQITQAPTLYIPESGEKIVGVGPIRRWILSL